MTKQRWHKAVNVLLALALALVMMAVLLMPQPALASTGHMLMNTGSYIGNGTDNTAITGIGFTPDVVLVKGNAGASTQAVVRTSSMTAGNSKSLDPGGNYTTNQVKSLDSGGFTIGTDGTVNSTGITYYWVAFKAAAGELKVGSYTGTGSAHDETGLGFSPAYVWVMRTAGFRAIHATSSLAGTSMDFGTETQTDGITAMVADGFTVGTSNRANTSGATYYYIAWKAVSGGLAVGSYPGNATDDRSITGVGFKPEWVIIQELGTTARHKPASTGASTDGAQLFGTTANETNSIQALESDGFQIGTTGVNINLQPHYYIAFNQVYNWESYESDRTTVRDTFNGSFTTAYMRGTGFPAVSYLIAYYDNGGTKTGSETQSASGGVLDSAYLLTGDPSAAAGTWHALVQPSSGYTAFGTASYATIVASPDTYGLVANDSFTVEQGAIPEFPTVIAAIGVAGSCAAIYWWMRKRRLAYVQA